MGLSLSALKSMLFPPHSPPSPVKKQEDNVSRPKPCTA